MMASGGVTALAQLRRARGLRGVTTQAVHDAVKQGRINSVGKDPNGRTFFPDLEVALREWEENTDPGRGAGASADDDDDDDTDTSHPPVSVSRRSKEAANARLAWLDVKKREGELIPAQDVARKWATETVAFRTEMLSVHVECKQAMPELTLTQVDKIEEIVRRKLTRLGSSDAD